MLCHSECESVSHVLWECPAYSNVRSDFLLRLGEVMGDKFEHFESLDSFNKSSFVLGSDAWEEYSSSLLSMIKQFVLDVWELRKVRLYGVNPNIQQPHSQSASGELSVDGGIGKLGCLSGKADIIDVCTGSAQITGCVVNGTCAMAAT